MKRTLDYDSRLAFTQEEVAEMLGISMTTMKKLVSRGEIEATTVSERLRRISKPVLERYLERIQSK